MSFTSTLVNAIFSLIFVIGLILLTAWAFRWWQKNRPTFQPIVPTARAPLLNQARLGVVASYAIDFKRKLLLIRRDDVLHLLLCGDGQDIVIETQIPIEPSPHAAINADTPRPDEAQ